MSKSRWEDICNHLKKSGFDVYAPAQHKGECTSSYVVIRAGSSDQIGNYSSVQQQYDILMYVPKDKYSELEPFVDSVERAMKGLEPMIKSLHSRTSSYYDDAVKAHMVSSLYGNNRRFA